MARPKTILEKLSIKEKNFLKKTFDIKKFEELDVSILKQLKERLKLIQDKRIKKKTIFKLWDIIMCVIIASFACNDDWDEIEEFVRDNYHFFKSFLQMTGGIPTAQTYERVMSLVDTKELNSILLDFYESITQKEKMNEIDFYRIDGRQNNGSKRNQTIFNKEVKPLNCLNVYSDNKNYCIDTIQISEKNNEIPNVKDYVKGIELKNVVVTTDALNTQKENVEAIVDSHGDYCLPIKGNHELLYNDLILYFDDVKCQMIIAGNTKSKYYTHIEKSHGSVIKYEYFQTNDVNWINDKNNWKKLNTIGMVRKTITKINNTVEQSEKGKNKRVKKELTTIENRYYISSLLLDIHLFEKAIRGHWNIENKLHFHLDFTFKQDKNTTLNKKALLNLEVIHKFNLALLRKSKPYYKKSLKTIRKHISNNAYKFFVEFIALLILQKNGFLDEKSK